MSVAVVRNVLVAAGAVTALVPASRITPLVRPQSLTTPAITLQRISEVPLLQLHGQANLDANSVQLDVWATTYAQGLAIADVCRTALEAATHCLTFESDNYDPSVDPDLFSITQNWSVWTT